MIPQEIVYIAYLVAAVLFILDLKWMAHPRTAVRGNRAGILGMIIAVVGHGGSPRSSPRAGSPPCRS